MEHIRGQAALLGLLGVTGLFAVQAFVLQDVVLHLPAVEAGGLRFGLAALVAAGLCRLAPQAFDWKTCRSGVLLGVLLALSVSAQNVALAADPPGRVAFLSGLYILLLPLGVRLGVLKRWSWQGSLGLLISLIGMGLLLHVPAGQPLADLAALSRALLNGMGLLLTARTRPDRWRALGFWQFATTGFLCLMFSFHSLVFPSAPVLWLEVLLTGLVGAGVGWSYRTWVYRHLSATRIGIVTLLEAPFTVLLGVFRGTSLSLFELTACVLMVSGAALVVIGVER